MAMTIRSALITALLDRWVRAAVVIAHAPCPPSPGLSNVTPRAGQARRSVAAAPSAYGQPVEAEPAAAQLADAQELGPVADDRLPPAHVRGRFSV